MSTNLLIRGARLPGHPHLVDIVVEGGTIRHIRRTKDANSVAADVIEADGRMAMPGFIDAHSHADGRLNDPEVQLSLLRQGVTTVLGGQDGVSYAPGDGAYASTYFAAINGAHPHYRGGGVAELLSHADGTSAVNLGYFVPAGTVRFEVCGRRSGPAGTDELRRMTDLVREGLAEGALGLSTGLDYVPGMFQSADEIGALASPVAAVGGVYVTHMRGGYEDNSHVGFDEILSIARVAHAASGQVLNVHVSHLHAEPSIVQEQMGRLSAALPATFDAYPYVRGCTLLGMPLLPPVLSVLDRDQLVAELADPSRRQELCAAIDSRASASASLGPDWPEMIHLAHINAPRYEWAVGLTLADGARHVNLTPAAFALEVLIASRGESNAVMAVPNTRSDRELASVFALSQHVGGSDGIFIGGHPHPRARGSFARYLRVFVRELEVWSWEEASRHLSRLPVSRFGLGLRGSVEPGFVADLSLVDTDIVGEGATYENPLALARGIDDVVVGGVRVLSDGALTGETPGRGLRRGDGAVAAGLRRN